MLASFAYSCPEERVFFMADFDNLMERAFSLAKKGLGYTSPNPPVGAILIKEGQIVGAGYHRKAGLPHAEIEALKKAGEKARGSTLIVTLEPCSHYGKTPPCTEALITAGIAQVVCATNDPNPVVSGSGLAALCRAGIEVIENVMNDYAREFYAPYFKYITTGIPYVTLKFAQSLDGRMATKTGHSQWISSNESLVYSHKLRAINDAILIGNGTLEKENPQLTTRLVKGPNPIRIILTQTGKVDFKKALFHDGQAPVYIATSASELRNLAKECQVIPVRKGKNGLALTDLLRKLGKMGIMTLMVEGGPRALTSFLKQRLADKIIVCVAPIIIGDGKNSVADLGIKKLDNAIRLADIKVTKSGPDCIMSGRPIWS
jgi:diaminohydroxyphosphoribosylaminopyrimidine deaminase/5-amino-6-(5-phosphoribosylamino)uracil reductase